MKENALRIINATENPAELISMGLKHSGRMLSPSLVRYIIAVKEKLPDKKFKSCEQLSTCLSNRFDIEDLDLFFGSSPEPKGRPENNIPMLLLPLRIETRFVGTEFLIRIYPDHVFVDNHDQELSAKEAEQGKQFFDLSNEKDRLVAWLELAQRYGSCRAAWIIKASHPSFPTLVHDSEWAKPARFIGLPDRFVVFIYLEKGELFLRREGEKIDKNITLIGDFLHLDQADAEKDEPALFDEQSDWVVNFRKAEKVGMAIRIALSPRELQRGLTFSKIIVTGIRSASPESSQQTITQLFDSHYYTHGFAFVPQGTPTNNTSDVVSPYSESADDYIAAYEREVEGSLGGDQIPDEPRSNAEKLSWALGLSLKPEVFRNAEHCQNLQDYYAEALNTALWPVTGDYFLRFMLKGHINASLRSSLFKHFRKYVRGGGFLPTIRVGKHPYGIIPVSRMGKEWQPSKRDDIYNFRSSSFDHKLCLFLWKLALLWNDRVDADESPVPRIGTEKNSELALMQFLSMAPWSKEVWYSRFINNDLASSITGISFLEKNSARQTKRLLTAWRSQLINRLKDLSSFIQSLFDLEQDLEIPLGKLLSFKNSELIPSEKPIVRDDTEPNDNPLRYLLFLSWRNKKATSSTILYEMLQRSLVMGEQFTDQVYSEALIQQAISELATCSVLEFFNTVENYKVIMDTIKDDPDFGSGPPHAYGIGKVKAKRILEIRKSLPNGKFESVDQIEQIRGIGVDTFHDILYTFRAEGVKDEIDRLFMQFLDTCSYRLDAWISSLANMRLDAMRQYKPDGICLGAYGYVENLRIKPSMVHLIPSPDNSTSQSAGYLHTPSPQQASMAAILYNGFLTHNNYRNKKFKSSLDDLDNPFVVNLPSKRLRKAAQLWEGIRNGQSLSELLGYQFERSLYDAGLNLNLNRYIDYCRRLFPSPEIKELIEKIKAGIVNGNGEGASGSEEDPAGDLASRSIVDGLALARGWQLRYIDDRGLTGEEKELKGQANKLDQLAEKMAPEERKQFISALDGVVSNMDALGDLSVTEAVYHAAGGNYDRSAAVLRSTAGASAPPEHQSMKIPESGTFIEHRLCFALPMNSFPAYYRAGEEANARGIAEPLLESWLLNLLGDFKKIGCAYRFLALDINEATVEQLEALPGITGALARKIVEHREENGPFRNLNTLIDIEGFNENILQNLDPHITIQEGFMSVAELKIGALDLLYLSTSKPSGEASAIERLIAYQVKKKHGLDHRVKVEIQVEDRSGFSYSIADAMALSSSLLEALGGREYLKPADLHRTVQEHAFNFTRSDVRMMKDRVRNLIIRPAKHSLQALKTASNEALPAELVKAARYGIAAAIPGSDDDPQMSSKKDYTVIEMERRINKGEILLAAAVEERDANHQIALLVKVCKEVFGESFIALPTFEKGSQDQNGANKDHLSLLNNVNDERIRLWLQQTAQVQSPAAALEDCISYACAWQQLSFQGSNFAFPVALSQDAESKIKHWVALSDEEIEPLYDFAKITEQEKADLLRPRNVLSIGVVGLDKSFAANNGSNRVAGLLLDQWVETIPEKIIDTSLAFQYNASNTQAPQCLLLAVPGRHSKTPELWTEDELALIVSDTMKLASIRAVDSDALPEVGGVFPALFMPADQSKPEPK